MNISTDDWCSKLFVLCRYAYTICAGTCALDDMPYGLELGTI